jgi:hypothetical protein
MHKYLRDFMAKNERTRRKRQQWIEQEEKPPKESYVNTHVYIHVFMMMMMMMACMQARVQGVHACAYQGCMEAYKHTV